MEKIVYTFADGTVSEIEVSDELYAAHMELVQAEKRNHWKNTRRHVSLQYLNEHEIDIEDTSGEPIDGVLADEEKVSVRKAMAGLPEKQQRLATQFFFEGMTTKQIAELEGVDRSAISHRLATVYKKIKNLL